MVITLQIVVCGFVFVSGGGFFFFLIILKGYSRISQIFKIIHKGINQNRSGYALKTKN